MEVIEFFEKNWVVLVSAPWTFVTIPLITSGVVFWFVKWHYNGYIQSLKGKIETLISRLTEKDEQLLEKDKEISRLRGQLGIIAVTAKSYTHLKNEELRSKTLNLVGEIREFVVNYQVKATQESLDRWPHTINLKSEGEKKQLLQDTIQSSMNFVNQYESRFKVEAILLRDEIRSRLPKEPSKEQSFAPPEFLYEHPTNSTVIHTLVDDLDRLAKSLPK
jgi:hypothetical protein